MKKILIWLPILLVLVIGFLGWKSSYKWELIVDNFVTTWVVVETTTWAEAELDMTTVVKNWNITLEEYSTHNSVEDCWVVYKWSVYDITTFLPIHPGWSKTIEPYCGTTAFEVAFERKHKEKKVEMLKNKAGTLQWELE